MLSLLARFSHIFLLHQIIPKYVENEAPDVNVRHRPLLLKEVEKYAVAHTGYRGLEVECIQLPMPCMMDIMPHWIYNIQLNNRPEPESCHI